MSKKKLNAKTNACRQLDQLKIPYEWREFEIGEDHLSAEEVAKRVAMPPGQIFKTLVVRAPSGDILVAVIPGDKALDLKALAAVSRYKKLDLLPLDQLEATTGYRRGGCSPIGMKKAYPTYLASEAADLATISISAGRRGAQLWLNPLDLERAVVGLRRARITKPKDA